MSVGLFCSTLSTRYHSYEVLIYSTDFSLIEKCTFTGVPVPAALVVTKEVVERGVVALVALYIYASTTTLGPTV